MVKDKELLLAFVNWGGEVWRAVSSPTVFRDLLHGIRRIVEVTGAAGADEHNFEGVLNLVQILCSEW